MGQVTGSITYALEEMAPSKAVSGSRTPSLIPLPLWYWDNSIIHWWLTETDQSCLIIQPDNMEGSRLDMALRNDPYIERYYERLYSSDDHWVLPLRLPASYVFNTDTSEGPGEHWVCFFIHSDRTVDYMDSYGTAPWDKIYQWLIKHGFGPVRFNKKWLQHCTSSIC